MYRLNHYHSGLDLNHTSSLMGFHKASQSRGDLLVKVVFTKVFTIHLQVLGQSTHHQNSMKALYIITLWLVGNTQHAV